jgi:hypothetical protein
MFIISALLMTSSMDGTSDQLRTSAASVRTDVYVLRSSRNAQMLRLGHSEDKILMHSPTFEMERPGRMRHCGACKAKA